MFRKALFKHRYQADFFLYYYYTFVGRMSDFERIAVYLKSHLPWRCIHFLDLLVKSRGGVGGAGGVGCHFLYRTVHEYAAVIGVLFIPEII